MTKRFFLLSLAMALFPFANVCVNAFAAGVQLQVRIDDPTENQPDDPGIQHIQLMAGIVVVRLFNLYDLKPVKHAIWKHKTDHKGILH